jgi:hypothetical protein
VSIVSPRGVVGVKYYGLAHRAGRGGHPGRAEGRGLLGEANKRVIIRTRPVQPHFDLPIIRAAEVLIGVN